MVPDYIEPFTGWRVWTVARHGEHLRLHSLHYPHVWSPAAPARATCEHPVRVRVSQRALMLGRPVELIEKVDTHADGVPFPGCRCGLYAARTLEHAAPYLRLRHREGDHPLIVKTTTAVFGRVHVWGRVEEHEHVWRAEYAYPAELLVPWGFRLPGTGVFASQAKAALGADYRVPARVVRDFAEAAS